MEAGLKRKGPKKKKASVEESIPLEDRSNKEEEDFPEDEDVPVVKKKVKGKKKRGGKSKKLVETSEPSIYQEGDEDGGDTRKEEGLSSGFSPRRRATLSKEMSFDGSTAQNIDSFAVSEKTEKSAESIPLGDTADELVGEPIPALLPVAGEAQVEVGSDTPPMQPGSPTEDAQGTDKPMEGSQTSVRPQETNVEQAAPALESPDKTTDTQATQPKADVTEEARMTTPDAVQAGLHEQTGDTEVDITAPLPMTIAREAIVTVEEEEPVKEKDSTSQNPRRRATLDQTGEAVVVDKAEGDGESGGVKAGDETFSKLDEGQGEADEAFDGPRRNLDPDGLPESTDGEAGEYMKRPKRENGEDDQEIPEPPQATQEETMVNGQHQESAEVEVPLQQGTVETPEEADDELPWAMYRGLQKREKEVDDDDLPDWKSEDELADQDGTPDFDEYINQLNNGEGELESENNPPPLFGSTQQQQMHKEVDDLKLGLAEEEINEYLEEFEKKMEEEILMIGSISLEDVQLEERRLREEHIGFQQQQAKLQRDRKQEIMVAMERAKKHVMQRFKEKYRKVRMREEHLMQRDRLVQDKIHRSFRRAENQLLRALKRRKGEVKTLYGDLIFADGQFGGSKGRRWKVDWNKTPQPVQIRLKCLRGVKDKLPASRYVLMVSLYDRLGGHVMKWSNLKGQQWGGATLPLFHEGEFFNIELKIDQSVFTVCPARPDVRPGMVLVYELFILRGSVTPTDKVVGWGCFPICDKTFNIVEGKYKTPLLRGDMDPNIDKFSTIEKLMAADLENWLCNLYFEIVKLPRYMAGQKEYEVELQFSSSLVSYPVRTKTGEEFVDGEKPVYGSQADLGSIRASRASLRSSHSASFFGSTYGFDQKQEEEEEKPGPSNMLTVGKVEMGSKKLRSSRTGSISSVNSHAPKADILSPELRQRKVSRLSRNDGDKNQVDNLPRAFTVHGSRKVVEEKGVCLTDDDSSGTDFSDDDVYNIKKDETYKPVKGQPGMFYKIHQNNPGEVYARKMYTMIPKTPKLNQQRRRKKMSHLEELQQHSFSVKPPWSNKGRIPRTGRERAQYIRRMLLAELGLSQWRSSEFWAMLLMLTITWWIRMFLHYLGQLGLIFAILVPVNKYVFLPYTVTLNYQNTLLKTREEIAVIVVGHFTNITVMLLLVAFSWFLQKLFGRFPTVFSKFIMAFGINTVFDPFWILVVDSALLRFRQSGSDTPIGDAFKLYWHFNRYYTNDNVLLFVSISITIFLYIATTFCASTLLYLYFLRLHNKGRMLDVFSRLQGYEDDFFLPFDLEISHEEITFICKKAEQWRGEEGERRKTAVYDYVWEEEEIPDENWDTANARGTKTGRKEVTTHISIHTIHLDGLRELYRHFLRSPEGAIVEVFQEMNVPGVDEAVKAALTKGTNYQGIDGLKRKRSFSDHSRSRASSRASSIAKGPQGSRRPSYFLDVPTFAPV